MLKPLNKWVIVFSNNLTCVYSLITLPSVNLMTQIKVLKKLKLVILDSDFIVLE